MSSTPNKDQYLLTDYGLLQVKGQDARKFLQGQLTCDLDRLTPERGLLGAACNLKGRAYASFFLVEYASNSPKADPIIGLIMPHGVIAETLSQLNKYALFFNVELSDASDQCRIMGKIEKSSEPSSTPAYSVEQSADRLTLSLPTLTPSRHEQRTLSLFMRPEAEATTTEEANRADHQAWKVSNIQHGTLLIEAGMEALFIPLELNYQSEALQGVHFDKGCYTGQEIVARLHYRGESKYRLVLATFQTDLNKEGDTLHAPTTVIETVTETLDHNKTKRAGQVVTWAATATTGYAALLVKQSLLTDEPSASNLALLCERDSKSTTSPSEATLLPINTLNKF